MDYKSFSGKVALITGASSGIGEATAVKFASLGVKLSLTGRDAQRLKATTLRCVQAGLKRNEIFCITGDLSQPEEVKKIVENGAKHFGSLDFLINCAGCIMEGSLTNTSDFIFDTVFTGNVKFTFAVTRQATPYLIQSKGAVVNVSSFVAIKPCFSYFAYTMAGAAIDQLTKALALDKRFKSSVNSPAIVKGTLMWTRKGAPYENASQEKLEKMYLDLEPMYPMRRIATVDDVTPAIAFLCSEKAGFITGAVMPIDGGKSLTSKAAPDCIPAKKM